jgi:hypothetical protein
MRVAGEDAIEWIPLANSDGVRIGRRGAGVIVEWPGIGRLSSSSDSDEFTEVSVASKEFLAKFRATSLLACRRYLAGRLSLHASAVGMPYGSVVLVGDSGAGKSTTAMALVERHGGTFLADDIVPIDWDEAGPIISPVEDSFWLNADASAWFGVSASTSREKSALPPRARADGPKRVRAIVHLVFDETSQNGDLQPITGQDAFTVLSGAHVCYSTGEDEDTLRNFAARARLAETTSVFRLRRRQTLDTLTLAARLLEEHLSSG